MPPPLRPKQKRLGPRHLVAQANSVGSFSPSFGLLCQTPRPPGGSPLPLPTDSLPLPCYATQVHPVLHPWHPTLTSLHPWGAPPPRGCCQTYQEGGHGRKAGQHGAAAGARSLRAKPHCQHDHTLSSQPPPQEVQQAVRVHPVSEGEQ